MVIGALSLSAQSGLQSSLKPDRSQFASANASLQARQAYSDAIFSANLLGQTDQTELTLRAMERDIKRLQGLKVDITPADAEQLAKQQDLIQRIETRAGPEGLSELERKDRAEAYRAAFKILGKEFVDVEDDSVLKGLVREVDTLLEPKLRGEKKTRLERLRKLQTNLEVAFIGGNRSQTLVRQLNNVLKQVENLVPPRLMSELNPAEKREYDGLVEKVNARAGTEMILSSRKRERIEQIQSAMIRLGG